MKKIFGCILIALSVLVAIFLIVSGSVPAGAPTAFAVGYYVGVFLVWFWIFGSGLYPLLDGIADDRDHRSGFEMRCKLFSIGAVLCVCVAFVGFGFAFYSAYTMTSAGIFPAGYKYFCIGVCVLIAMIVPTDICFSYGCLSARKCRKYFGENEILAMLDDRYTAVGNSGTVSASEKALLFKKQHIVIPFDSIESVQKKNEIFIGYICFKLKNRKMIKVISKEYDAVKALLDSRNA